ncbi:MAG: PHP domain-containing protein [bacterium]
MNDVFSVFPKVIPLGQKAKITISGLRDKTIIPGQSYKVRILSMTNHQDSMQFNVSALFPKTNTKFSDPSHGGIIEFEHVFTSKGEYSIVLMQNDNNSFKVTTERVYAINHELAGLYPYKGDLHIHTYYSDGRMSPIYMAIIGKKLGLDFAAITDHGKYEPSLEAIRVAKEIDLDMLLFPGEEVDFPAGHIVSINAEASITNLRNNKEEHQKMIDETISKRLKDKKLVDNLSKEHYAHALWIIDKIHEYGGCAFLAHPYWVSSDRYHLHLPIFEQLLEDGDMDGIEVIGGYFSSEFESNWLAVAKYYEEFAKGHKYPLIGNSDTHYRSGKPGDDLYGWYWTTVFSKSLSKEDILDSILNMRCVACERPNGERFIAVGPFDLVEYTCFLDREFFPIHDRICSMEAEIYLDILMEKSASIDQLLQLRRNLSELYELSFWK